MNYIFTSCAKCHLNGQLRDVEIGCGIAILDSQFNNGNGFSFDYCTKGLLIKKESLWQKSSFRPS
jgi:hypothetical protein